MDSIVDGAEVGTDVANVVCALDNVFVLIGKWFTRDARAIVSANRSSMFLGKSQAN